MAKPDALRRLGGGRWETRDGRFQIEPQSGTWVIVDTTQTNEFGLPLVRGPYPSLGDARDAIDTARTEGPVTSPLADRIDEVQRAARPVGKALKTTKRAAPTPAADGVPEPIPEPAPPPDPAWFRDLTFADRRRAKGLIARLGTLEIADAEAVARAEVAEGEPALARLALERRLRAAAVAAKDPHAAVAAAIEAILSGEDEALGAEWRLVDGRGLRIERLDPDQ